MITRVEIEHTLDKLSHFIDGLDSRKSSYDVAAKVLHELYGGLHLGSGYFSSVISIDALPGAAIKICTDAHDAWQAWALFCMLYKPSFGMEVYGLYKGAGYYIAIMPKYRPIEWSVDYEQFSGRYARALNRQIDCTSNVQDIQLAEFMAHLGAEIDVAERNTMRTEDGRFILTDPICNGAKERVHKFVERQMELARRLQLLAISDERKSHDRQILAKRGREPEVRAIDTVEPLRAVTGGKDKPDWFDDIYALLQMQRVNRPLFAADPGAIKRIVGVEWSAPKFIRRSARRPFNAVLRAGGSMARKVRNGRRHGEIVRFLREQFPGQALYASMEQSLVRSGVWHLRISGEGAKRPIAEISFKPEHSGGWSDVELWQLRRAIAAGLDRRHHERMAGRQGDKRLRDPRHVFIRPQVVFDPGRLPTVQEMVDLAGWGQGGGQGPPQGAAEARAVRRPGGIHNDAKGPERLFG